MVTSSLGKQIVGATLGVAIAALLYFAIDQLSLSTLPGYLVNVGENISSNAGQVNTNAKTVDEGTLRRIASRAQTVANQLAKSAIDTGSPQTAINLNTEARKAVRLGQQETQAAKENLTEYQVVNAEPVSEEERLAMRVAAVAKTLQDGHAGASLYKPVETVITPEELYKGKGVKPFEPIQVPTPIINEVKIPIPQEPEIVVKEVKVPIPSEPRIVIKEVKVPTPPKTIIKEVFVPTPTPPRVITRVVEQQYGKNLPDSGPVLHTVLLLSALGALAILRPDLKHRLIALASKHS